jgi:hypothetical protein
MPIWLRKFNINQINEHNKKQNDEYEKSKGQSNIGDGQVQRPNINPANKFKF